MSSRINAWALSRSQRHRVNPDGASFTELCRAGVRLQDANLVVSGVDALCGHALRLRWLARGEYRRGPVDRQRALVRCGCVRCARGGCVQRTFARCIRAEHGRALHVGCAACGAHRWVQTDDTADEWRCTRGLRATHQSVSLRVSAPSAPDAGPSGGGLRRHDGAVRFRARHDAACGLQCAHLSGRQWTERVPWLGQRGVDDRGLPSADVGRGPGRLLRASSARPLHQHVVDLVRFSRVWFLCDAQRLHLGRAELSLSSTRSLRALVATGCGEVVGRDPEPAAQHGDRRIRGANPREPRQRDVRA